MLDDFSSLHSERLLEFIEYPLITHLWRVELRLLLRCILATGSIMSVVLLCDQQELLEDWLQDITDLVLPLGWCCKSLASCSDTTLLEAGQAIDQWSSDTGKVFFDSSPTHKPCMDPALSVWFDDCIYQSWVATYLSTHAVLQLVTLSLQDTLCWKKTSNWSGGKQDTVPGRY